MSNDTDARTFMSLFREVYQHFYRRFETGEYQIRPESLAILQHLRQSGPLTITEAAAHFSRSQSAMSEIVERLETRELVQRIADERDRRRHLIWLSPKGMAILSQSEDVLSIPLLTAAMKAMSTNERTGLMSGIRALLDAAETLKPMSPNASFGEEKEEAK